MAWQTPKTNWVSTDHISYRDWNRISYNASYIQWMGETWLGIEQTYTQVEKGNEWSYANEWNDLCEAVWSMNAAVLHRDVQMPTYYPSGPTPTATDLNTIESLELAIYEVILNIIESGKMMLEAQLEGGF